MRDFNVYLNLNQDSNEPIDVQADWARVDTNGFLTFGMNDSEILVAQFNQWCGYVDITDPDIDEEDLEELEDMGLSRSKARTVQKFRNKNFATR